MWWTEDGDRVLTDEEWDVFSTGLGLLHDLVEADLAAGDDDLATAGIRAFDDLTSEQKIALLADVAEALRYRVTLWNIDIMIQAGILGEW